MGSFTYGGLRFLLGALSLVPLMLWDRRRRRRIGGAGAATSGSFRRALLPGLGAGILLFAAANLQQFGLVGTSAGKAAFITGLYIVLVPLAGLFFRHKPGFPTWAGAVLATAGLWLLSVRSDFTVSPWDLLVLVGAFFWTFHILWIDRWTCRVDVLSLAFIQYVVTAVLSLGAAWFTEPWKAGALEATLGPLLFGGIVSVGVAYTLQIFGQKESPPAAASLILSLEAVFAALAGGLFLGEILGPQELLGCGLMLAGMLGAQIKLPEKPDTRDPERGSSESGI